MGCLFGHTLQATWHTPHLRAAAVASLIQQQFAPHSWTQLTTTPVPLCITQRHERETFLRAEIPLYMASVVPTQSALWQAYPASQELNLEQIPVGNLYPTLGIDRALNLVGAGDRYGWPVLVIDSGTALTFTAGEVNTLLGGAILPGLEMQFKALGEHTANLPQIAITESLPPRWAQTTPDSIRSGIVRSVIATVRDFLVDWRCRYPHSPAVFTGGDGPRLLAWLSESEPFPHLHSEPDLMFWGMRFCRQHLLAAEPTDH
ncbi:MAG: pantothenate kinase [Leptolyngbya sp. SIO1D8]|nr:pantothenate kinase [Leptolyngbya sp. SIO1D8]